MTNAEKFKEDWGFEPNVIHCPKCGRESCMVCPYAEKRFEECASDWWKSEYERTPISDEELSKFIAEEMDKGSKLFKGAVCKVLEDVRAEINKEIEDIKEISRLTIATKAYMSALITCRKMIERKIKEIKHECSACTHSDEVDGERCYECVKGLANNFEEGNEE